MLEGLMQHDYPLTLQHVLDRMRGLNARRRGRHRRPRTGVERATHGEVAERVDRLARALASLGVRRRRPRGDVRLEHPAPPRGLPGRARAWAPCCTRSTSACSPSSCTYIVNHAQDKVILVDASLVPVLEKLAPTFETVEHYVVMGDGDRGSLPTRSTTRSCWRPRSPASTTRQLDDRAAAGLCYTSGTTGNPKGVLYSHRSSVLHAMGVCLADAMALSPRRPRPAGRADVPRQRLGPALRGDAGRRRPRAARRSSSRPSRSRA